MYSCDRFVMQEVGSRNRSDTFLFPLRFVFTFIFISHFADINLQRYSRLCIQRRSVFLSLPPLSLIPSQPFSLSLHQSIYILVPNVPIRPSVFLSVYYILSFTNIQYIFISIIWKYN